MNEIAFDVLMIVVSICVAVVTRYLIPYLKNVVSDNKYDAVIEIIKVAVEAAEQTIKDSGQGKAKKAQVIAFVSHWLTEKGIHITEEQLDKLIESAVWQLNND